MTQRMPRAVIGSVFIVAAGFTGLIMAAAPAAQPAADPPSYRLVESWPQWPTGKKFEGIGGVAVDAKGIVYVFTRDEHETKGAGGQGSISMFDQSGKYLGAWGKSDQPGFAVTPHDLQIDREGFFWTVDRDGQQVKKFRPDGTLVMTVGGLRKFGSTTDTFNGPTQVAVLPSGDFVVSDGYFNSRVMWFDKNGKFLKQVGEFGRGDGKFWRVHAVVRDTRGRLFVVDGCGGLHQDSVMPGQIDPIRIERRKSCDAKLDTIAVLDADGKFLTRWTNVPGPLALAIAGDRIYSTTDRTSVAILDVNTGRMLGTIKNANSYVIHNIGVDPVRGDVYATAALHGGIQRWTPQPAQK